VGQDADGDVVHAGFGDRPRRVEAQSAAGLSGQHRGVPSRYSRTCPPGAWQLLAEFDDCHRKGRCNGNGLAWHLDGIPAGDLWRTDVRYIRAASRILLILTLIGAAATFVIGVLLFFHLA
jgi:hypothetical protein